MFLGLGGSRRRGNWSCNAQLPGSSTTTASASPASLLQELSSNPGAARSDHLPQKDPLQSLATGKYARGSLIRSDSSGEGSSSPFVAVSAGGCCNLSPGGEAVQKQVNMCSPKSTLSYYLPSPILPSLSRETSFVSSDSGVSLHGVNGAEEAMSRDCTRFEAQLGGACSATRRGSPTLDLAKKLKHSLGSKFADSLRETIMEAVMNQEKVEAPGKFDSSWPPALVPQSLQNVATSSGDVSVSQSVSGKLPWDGCWSSVEKSGNGTVTSSDQCHSSSLPFSSVEGLTTLEERSEPQYSMKRSFGEHSKRLSWFSQENLSQSAIAELSWDVPSMRPLQTQLGITTPSSSMVTEFFSPDHPSDVGLYSALKESGTARESYTDHHRSGAMSAGFPSSRSAVPRPHALQETTATGTLKPDSLHPQQNGNLSARPRGEPCGSKPSGCGVHTHLIKKANGMDRPFLEVSRGFRNNGKDYECLLEFLNHPDHPSVRVLRDDARQRLYGKSAAEDSCGSVHSWHEIAASGPNIASTSYCHGATLLSGLRESTCGASPGMEPSIAAEKLAAKGTTRDSDAAYASLQSPSKRQCSPGSSSLDVPAATIFDVDDHGAVTKSDPIAGGFEEYLANLAATARVPSYELPGSLVATLLEDFSQDSIVPIHHP